MAPLFRPKLAEIKDADAFKPSAVMLLLCKDPYNSWFVPLTLRQSYGGAHSAQVSLPGGKFDAADQSLQTTALRECAEEIGISNVQVLGELSKLHIPVSGYMVQPFVGVCLDAAPHFVPQVREVQSILKLPITALGTNELLREGEIALAGGAKIQSPWYEVEGKRVWGATAMILSEFRELLFTV